MGFFTGIQLYGKAFGILFSRKFWWFLLFPVIILLLLFIGGNILISLAGDSLYGLIEAKLTAWVGGISWLQWVTTTTSVLIKIVLRILYFFLFVAFGGYIVLVVMSPVYSWLSERTEAHLTGREFPFSFRQFAWEIFRGILIAPFAIFFTSAYFYGFAFIDYAIERKRFNVRQSVRYVNKNIGLVTGIGTVFALALMIPALSLAACCFVSLLSVIAGTIAVERMNDKSVK